MNDMIGQKLDGRQFAIFTADHQASLMGDGKINPNEIIANISNQALENMGMSSSAAIIYLVRDAMRNDPELAGESALKLIPAEVHEIDVGRHGFEAKQQEQERWQEKQDANKDFFADKKALEERLLEEKMQQKQAWENRPAEDAQNMRILGAPMAFAGLAVTLGLGAEAIKATGNILSPHGDALGGTPTMIASNNGGSLTSQAQNILGAPQNNLLVTGPNQTQSPTLGQPAPTLQQSGVTPPSIAPIPGMNGPSGAG